MVDTYVIKLAQQIAIENKLSNCEINVLPTNKKGDGFTGDLRIVTIRSKTGSLDLILKCAITDQTIIDKFNIKNLFEYERNFYTNVVPLIHDFQKKHCTLHTFNATAKYFGSHFDGNTRIIAIENLRTHGFQTVDKKSLVDSAHVKMVFSQYGRLHAFSFAYRNSNPIDYQKLEDDFKSIWGKVYLSNCSFVAEDIFREVVERMSTYGDKGLIGKLEKYRDSTKVFTDVCDYKGKHSAFLHGDCWSNNVMFKYQDINGEKQLVDMRFIDWQLCNIGTPVYDLSYFLYSSSSKEVFNDLDYYLRVYYDNFSTTLREMGGDPETIFPFSALKADWKVYCKFGFIFGIFLQRIKLIKEDDVKDFRDIKDDEAKGASNNILDTSIDKELFEERSRNLILHMYEIGAL